MEEWGGLLCYSPTLSTVMEASDRCQSRRTTPPERRSPIAGRRWLGCHWRYGVVRRVTSGSWVLDKPTAPGVTTCVVVEPVCEQLVIQVEMVEHEASCCFRWRAMVFSFSQARAARAAAMVARRASCSRCAVAVAAWAAAAASSSFLSSMERLEVLPDMVGKTVVVTGGGGWRWILELGQRWAEAKKKWMALITMLERCAVES
jgi:hypothetical protein